MIADVQAALGSLPTSPSSRTRKDHGMSLKVILNGNFGKTQLQQRVADMIADQAIWVEDADAAISALPSADALICPNRFYSATIAEAVRNAAPKLRWIQLLNAGYDHAKQHGAPAHIAVCNAGPAYAPAVAMHAVALALSQILRDNAANPAGLEITRLTRRTVRLA